MKPSFFQTFILFLTFLSPSLSSTEPGTLIILYGTPCSGKSTLGRMLRDTLPGNFQVVKKDSVVKREREALIERATGTKVEGDLEVLEGILDNLNGLREEIKQIHTDAVEEVLHSIKTQVDNGENIIFDVCLRDTISIESIAEMKTLKILVYAPLSVLSDRSSKRAVVNSYSEKFEHRRWLNILTAFRQLFRPSEVQEPDFFATASKRELTDLFQKYRAQDIVSLERETKRAIKSFDLQERNWVAISPNYTPDLFINTSILTQQESLSKIVNAYESRIKTQSPKD